MVASSLAASSGHFTHNQIGICKLKERAKEQTDRHRTWYSLKREVQLVRRHNNLHFLAIARKSRIVA